MAGASAEIGIPAAAVRALGAGADLLCLGPESDAYVDEVHEAIVAAVQRGELSAERLRDAAARVGGLTRPEAPAEVEATSSEIDPGRIAAAFDVQEAAAAALTEPGDWTVVKLESMPNIAVGVGAWGPFAAADHEPEAAPARRFSAWRRIDVDSDAPGRAPVVEGRALVIGRDIHLHPRARAVIDGLRAGGGTVVVVDMGWPSPDRRYADVATFGGSRAVGAALLDLLAGAAR
jgi:beta-N-acetylhexosaminidase